MFNVPPEKIAQFKVPTVCLEHGKPEPRPAIAYEIQPIESVTDKPEVQELCRMLGTGQINQRAAQVAAWNLNNGMSWQQLAAKQLQYANGASEPYFTPKKFAPECNWPSWPASWPNSGNSNNSSLLPPRGRATSDSCRGIGSGRPTGAPGCPASLWSTGSRLKADINNRRQPSSFTRRRGPFFLLGFLAAFC